MAFTARLWVLSNYNFFLIFLFNKKSREIMDKNMKNIENNEDNLNLSEIACLLVQILLQLNLTNATFCVRVSRWLNNWKAPCDWSIIA